MLEVGSLLVEYRVNYSNTVDVSLQVMVFDWMLVASNPSDTDGM